MARQIFHCAKQALISILFVPSCLQNRKYIICAVMSQNNMLRTNSAEQPIQFLNKERQALIYIYIMTHIVYIL